MNSSLCQPMGMLIAAIVLIPVSLILQFSHVVLMIIYQKPDKEKKIEQPVEWEIAHTNYRKKLVWENILAAVIILLNILISYSIVEQIKNFDTDTCSF